MNRYKVRIQSLTFTYELGYYYGENPDVVKDEAWVKHKSTFRDCSRGMLSASLCEPNSGGQINHETR
jgi:hypothetical protein